MHKNGNYVHYMKDEISLYYEASCIQKYYEPPSLSSYLTQIQTKFSQPYVNQHELQEIKQIHQIIQTIQLVKQNMYNSCTPAHKIFEYHHLLQTQYKQLNVLVKNQNQTNSHNSYSLSVHVLQAIYWWMQMYLFHYNWLVLSIRCLIHLTLFPSCVTSIAKIAFGVVACWFVACNLLQFREKLPYRLQLQTICTVGLYAGWQFLTFCHYDQFENLFVHGQMILQNALYQDPFILASFMQLITKYVCIWCRPCFTSLTAWCFQLMIGVFNIWLSYGGMQAVLSLYNYVSSVWSWWSVFTLFYQFPAWYLATIGQLVRFPTSFQDMMIKYHIFLLVFEHVLFPIKQVVQTICQIGFKMYLIVHCLLYQYDASEELRAIHELVNKY